MQGNESYYFLDLTCWTCPGMRTNQECNDWAPDIHCPQSEYNVFVIAYLLMIVNSFFKDRCFAPSEHFFSVISWREKEKF